MRRKETTKGGGLTEVYKIMLGRELTKSIFSPLPKYWDSSASNDADGQ